jgi:pimeloyl-ACP methyl ester carboxylesterase
MNGESTVVDGTQASRRVVSTDQAHIPPVVLVHGAWHTARAWQRLTPLLQQSGMKVAAVDLPARGDATAAAHLRMADYVAALAAVVATFQEPVLVVAHSFGGMVATQFADENPAAVAGVLYLAAFVPKDGQAVMDLVTDPAFAASETSKQSLHLAEGYSTFPSDDANSAFYSDVAARDFAHDRPHLVPESLVAMTDRVPAHPQGVLAVRRGYIECSRDRALPIEMQRKMRHDTGVPLVATLEADHSPFYSQPEALLPLIRHFASTPPHAAYPAVLEQTDGRTNEEKAS